MAENKKKKDIKSILKSFFLLITPTVLVLLIVVFLAFNVRQERKHLTDEIRANAPGKFLLLGEGKVHYRLEGEGSAPLIVFVHGGGVTGEEVWKENIPFFLENGYQVLSYDLYGRGYSDRPHTVHNPELFLKQLEQLLEKLDINKPFYLVALSMGGMIALDYAYAHPRRVKKLVLIDPATAGNYEIHPLLKFPIISDFLMTVLWYPKAIENQRKEFVSNKKFNTYSKRLAYFMDFKGYKQSNYSTWKNMLNKSKLHLVEGIPPSSLLLIYGDNDPYFREGQKDSFKARLPSLEIAKIQDAGHMPNYEKPDEVNRLIHGFFTEHVRAHNFQKEGMQKY